MSKPPPLGRPRSHHPPPAPPQRNLSPTPSPQSDTDPDSDRFDPNRTPPPPGVPIFFEDIPEQKVFEIPPLRRLPGRVLRPLTGRPLAPRLPTGVKQPKESGSRKKARTSRRATVPTDTVHDPLAIIQTSLHKIQSYLDTLTAVRAQQNSQPPRHHYRPNPDPPRASLAPSSPPATLADLISVPQRSRKR